MAAAALITRRRAAAPLGLAARRSLPIALATRFFTAPPSGGERGGTRDRPEPAAIDAEASAATAASSPSMAAVASSPPAAALSSRDYAGAVAELSKARLSALVVSTASAGFLAAGGPISYSAFAACCAGTALCSSSASTFNQAFEVDRDRRMKRTRQRPLVTRAVSTPAAWSLGTASGLGGGGILLAGTDPITAGLGVANIALYAGLYTHLKPRSEANTWVGAVVGAVPPVMGWTAAGGSPFDAEAILLGSTLFLWQFPHFFALNWMYRADYARGGFAMVSVNDPQGDRTASLITRYTWYMSSLPLVSSALGVTSSMFAVEGLILNAYALHVARKFDKDRSNANARKVFLTSLWYLPCFMTLFILHSRTWREGQDAENKLENEDDLRAMIQRRISAVRNRGRELCVHEAIVAKDIEVTVGREELDGSKCPIALGRSKAQEARKEVAETKDALVMKPSPLVVKASLDSEK